MNKLPVFTNIQINSRFVGLHVCIVPNSMKSLVQSRFSELKLSNLLDSLNLMNSTKALT